VRRFPHGGTNRPGYARPAMRYGQLPFRPGPVESVWPLRLPHDVLRWADATVRLVTSDRAEVEALWVLDEHA
jgi:hypothetical protein